MMKEGLYYNKAIGELIRKRREELGLSQEELGKKMNIKTRSTISHYEKGEKSFKQSQIKALASALDVNPLYFMELPYDEKFDINEVLNKDEIYEKAQLLNDEGRAKVLDYINDLLANSKNRKKD